MTDDEIIAEAKRIVENNKRDGWELAIVGAVSRVGACLLCIRDREEV